MFEVALTDTEVCETVTIERNVPKSRKFNRKVHTVRAERILDSDLTEHISPKQKKLIDSVYKDISKSKD